MKVYVVFLVAERPVSAVPSGRMTGRALTPSTPPLPTMHSVWLNEERAKAELGRVGGNGRVEEWVVKDGEVNY